MAAALKSLGAHYAATRDIGAVEASLSPDPLAPVESQGGIEAPAAARQTPAAAQPILTADTAPVATVPAEAVPANLASKDVAPRGTLPLEAPAVETEPVTPASPPPSPLGFESGTEATAPAPTTPAPTEPTLDQVRIARLIGTVRRASPPPDGARAVLRRSLTSRLGAWSLSRSEAAVFVLLFTGLSLGAYTSLAKLPILSNGRVDTAIAAVSEPAGPVAADPVSTGSLGATARDSATDPQALFTLASRLERGEGVAANPERARALYAEAAAAGNVMAMHNLAVMAFEGAGGPRDPALAASWFEKAAEHGLVDSEFNLAVLYLKGVGAKADPAAAYRWFAIAARAGDTKAAKRPTRSGRARPRRPRPHRCRGRRLAAGAAQPRRKRPGRRRRHAALSRLTSTESVLRSRGV